MPLGEWTEWLLETWTRRTGLGDPWIGQAGTPVKSGPGKGGIEGWKGPIENRPLY